MPPNAEVKGIRQRPAHITTKTTDAYDDEVLINGRWYDISNFTKRHPGGRILNFYRGKDASEAYNEFHNRSHKADKMLNSLKSRTDDSKLSSQLDPLSKDFADLREQLRAEGFYEPSIPHVIYRITEVIAMHAAGFWMISQGWTIGGLMLLGLVQGRCGWLMHEGGHHSLTGNIAIDIPIQVVMYGMGCGMSASFWRNQHNKHHATPQKIDHDVDLDTLPLVMFNVSVKDGKQKNLYNKHWVRLQAYLFAPLTVLIVCLGWQFFLHPRHSLRTGRYHELASMALRYVVVGHFVLNTDYGMGNVALAYLFYDWVGASYIFLNFAVSHTHKPVIQADEDVSWVRYSSDHTMNVEPGPFGWVNWWMSFLNYQIEHHLFPTMPQFRHPQVSPRVRALFEKHGVEYDSRGYFDAMALTFKNLDQVGKEAFYG